MKHLRKFAATAALGLLATAVSSATAGEVTFSPTFSADAFRIGDGGQYGTINSESAHAVDVSITGAGQKVAFGTNDFNGKKLGSILSVDYDHSGNDKSPYVNVWIMDGLGNHAMLTALSADGDGRPAEMVSGENFQALTANLYETDLTGDMSWLGDGFTFSGAKVFKNGVRATVADLAHLIVNDPGANYFSNKAPMNGTGFNFIFGDSASGYLGNSAISNITVTTIVPTPSAALAGFGLMGVTALRRRRVA